MTLLDYISHGSQAPLASEPAPEAETPVTSPPELPPKDVPIVEAPRLESPPLEPEDIAATSVLEPVKDEVSHRGALKVNVTDLCDLLYHA